MKARVHVTLKPGVLDPQGKAIGRALESLGFTGIQEVRQGKFIEVTMDDTDRDGVHAQVTAMCEKLLANTVIENFSVDVGE